MNHIVLAILLATFSASVSAEVYRCKTPDGKTQISDSPCSGGSKTTTVRSNEEVTPWQQYQAQQDLQRQRDYIAGREAEDAAIYQQRKQAYQQMELEDNARKRAESEKAAIEAKQRKDSDQSDCIRRVQQRRNPPAMTRQQLLSECRIQVQPEPERDVAHAPAPNIQPVVKGCSGANCSDQFGNRYTTTLGKTVRQDGKRCYQSGKVMYCD